MATQDSEQIKAMVRDTYSEIAEQSRSENASSCCGVGGCETVDYEVFAEDYKRLEGYVPEADLGLGCGIPTEFAKIRSGDTVVDLGSGAGNDAFVARALTGESGKVIGIDMTDAMIDKARDNADKLGFNNVEFRKGDIEAIPMAADRADVVLSNCVLNLVPDKTKAFNEIFRILKPGGHLCISDIVISGALPAKIASAAEMYVGCVSGALPQDEYLDIIRKAGFSNVNIAREKRIDLPEDILNKYLSPEEIEAFRASGTAVLSVTVYAEKAGEEACCGPDCC